jgi:hypothetical protein
MALMRTGRKMMMDDPPSLPKRPQDIQKAMSDLKPVKISGGSKDDIYGTFARKGDIEDAKSKNKAATETYNHASREYAHKAEVKSSYDKMKYAYDDYVKGKPTRKAKGTIDDMTEQQHNQAYGIGILTGQDRHDYLKANPDRAKSVLPNENIGIYSYRQAMEQKKKTGKFDPLYEAREATDEQIRSYGGGVVGKTKRYHITESTFNDPGADPGGPGEVPKSPELVKPKTYRVEKIKIPEKAESWNAPTRTRGGGYVFKGEKVPVKKTNEKKQKGYTYGKEKKMAAAYYGVIGSTFGEDDRYATSGELGDFQKFRKEEIKGLKKQRADAKGRVAKREITEDIKSSRKDIRETKLGKKYVESLPNKYQSIAGVAKDDISRNTANEKEVAGENKPKRVIRVLTPEKMKGSTEQERQAMLKEKKKVKNLGRKEIIRPRNR